MSMSGPAVFQSILGLFLRTMIDEAENGPAVFQSILGLFLRTMIDEAEKLGNLRAAHALHDCLGVVDPPEDEFLPPPAAPSGKTAEDMRRRWKLHVEVQRLEAAAKTLGYVAEPAVSTSERWVGYAAEISPVEIADAIGGNLADFQAALNRVCAQFLKVLECDPVAREIGEAQRKTAERAVADGLRRALGRGGKGGTWRSAG